MNYYAYGYGHCCYWKCMCTPSLLINNNMYSRSLIIETLITALLARPGLIKYSKFLDYWDFFLIIPRNTTIPIIKGWDFFWLPGTFSGPCHPDNQGLVVYKMHFSLMSNVTTLHSRYYCYFENVLKLLYIN